MPFLPNHKLQKNNLKPKKKKKKKKKGNHAPELINPTSNTVFRPPYSESATRPHNIPVHTCAAVFEPTRIPACVEMSVSEAVGLKKRSW
jgi:hypothetical protein